MSNFPVLHTKPCQVFNRAIDESADFPMQKIEVSSAYIKRDPKLTAVSRSLVNKLKMSGLKPIPGVHQLQQVVAPISLYSTQQMHSAFQIAFIHSSKPPLIPNLCQVFSVRFLCHTVKGFPEIHKSRDYNAVRISVK